MSPSLEIPAEPLDLSVQAAVEDGAVLATERGFDPTSGLVYTLYVIGNGDGLVAKMLTLTAPAVLA